MCHKFFIKHFLNTEISLNNKSQNSASIITFYHDIEQNFDSHADPAECRQMVSEFLKLEKKYNISSTYNVVGKLFIDQPDLVNSISNEGQEVAFHSFNHQTDWNPAYFSNEIELCRKVSKKPTGYRSPRSQITQSAVKDIWKNGFLWNAEGDNHTEPYYIYKGLVRLPIAGDDWSLYLGHVSTDKWVQNFSKLLKSRTYVAFGLHDYIASTDPEKILQAWEKLLQIAVESGALLLNFSEVADLFRRTTVSKYIKNNKHNKNYNISKLFIRQTFADVIEIEAKKLDKPVIANLYLIDEKLPFSIKELAKEVYSISTDPGLISKHESDVCSETPPDKVLELKPKVNFADIIVCMNCIEYQFWPDQLADKIKQIGKIGATFIVTFPSIHEDSSSYSEYFPESIKHYFNKDEFQEWANQIGPGEIICTEDIIAGENLDKIRSGILQSEYYKRSPQKVTICLFKGTVQKKYMPSSNRKTILISDNTFRFPNPVYDRIRIILKQTVRRLFKPLRRVGKIILKRN